MAAKAAEATKGATKADLAGAWIGVGGAIVDQLRLSASEAGSYLRLIDFVYHSTLGSRVIKKKRG